MEKEYIGARNRLLPILIIVKDNKFGKESIMLTIPSAAQSLFMSFSIAFTQPTFQRVLPLAIGGILTMGRRTVTGILWTMRGLITGHSSTYHRVFSRAVWSLWPLGKVLAVSVFTARAAIMTRCVRPTSMWSFAGDTAGSCWVSP